jgi:hypothetical protein
VASTAAARVRRGSADFLTSFASLRNAVSAACTASLSWEARVVTAIEAALEFAAREPAMTRAVLVHSRREPTEHGDREQEVISHFAGMLGDAAPAQLRHSVSTDEGVIEAIAAVIRGHLQAGSFELLPDAAPDLAYLALMPYLGLDGARRWANSLAAGQIQFQSP